MENEKVYKKKKVVNLIQRLDENKKLIFHKFVDNYTKDCFKPRRLDCFIDILENNNEDFFRKYDLYVRSPASYEAKEARYGNDYVKQYKQNLLNRPKIDRKEQNNYDPIFLSQVHGISIDEANLLVEDRKIKISVSSTNMHKQHKKNGYSYRDNNPMCI